MIGEGKVYIEGCETDQHHPHIRLFFGAHGLSPKDIEAQNAEMSFGRAILEGSESGKVFFFLEQPDTPPSIAALQTELVDSGIKLSHSYFCATYFSACGHMPDDDIVEQFGSLSLAFSPYRFHWLRNLDVLHNDFPGRVALATERSSGDANNTSSLAKERVFFDEYERVMGIYLSNSDVEGGVDFLRRTAEEKASQIATRDLEMSKKIIEIAQVDDVLAILGRFGASHIGITERLQNCGYTVTQVLTGDTCNGEFCYDGLNDLIRRMASPNEGEGIEDSDLVVVMVRIAIERLLRNAFVQEHNLQVTDNIFDIHGKAALMAVRHFYGAHPDGSLIRSQIEERGVYETATKIWNQYYSEVQPALYD